MLRGSELIPSTVVIGPGSATDHAFPRYDGTTGKLLQDSGVICDDSDNLTGIASLSVTGAGKVTYRDADLSVHSQSDGNLTVSADGTITMSTPITYATGLVGVQIAVPKGTLHVSDGSASGISAQDALIITDATKPILFFEDLSESAGNRVITARYINSTLIFGSMNDAGSSFDVDDLLVVHRDGNVGIGTATPGTELEIEDSTGHAILTLNGGTNLNSWIYFEENSVLKAYAGYDANENAYQIGTGSDVLSITDAGNVGIGTVTVPHGGIGAAKFAIDGPSASIDGPHTQWTTSADDYPLMQLFYWGHDDIAIYFDSYNAVAAVRSSDLGSCFRIRKASDLLTFGAETGIAQGSTATFLTAFQIEADAEVMMSPGAALKTYWWDSAIGINVPSDSNMAIFADGSVTLSTPITYVSGSLGVGGSSPSTLFVVHGNDANGLLAKINRDSTTAGHEALLGFNVTTNEASGVTSALGSVRNGGFVFKTNADGITANLVERMRILGTGEVGIGIVAPTEKLQVSGNIFLTTDSNKQIFGTGKDVEQYYDGTDFKIVTDIVAASDFIVDCGTEKTLELTEPVWEDIQFHISTGNIPGANFPTWSAFTTNTKAYQFSVNDYIDLEAQELNHKWKEGGTGNFHLHLALDAASAAALRYAKFEVYVAFADAATGVYGETTLTAELTIPISSLAKKEFYLDMGDITFTNRTIGTQVVVSLKRIAATTGTDYADEIFITQCGAHIEQIRMGSRTEIVA